jgi:uncharacterized protein YndB with AHSA1/START domain
MINNILLGLIIIVFLFAGYVMTLPDNISISRSAQFAASPAKVFAHVNDLHKWDEWSPWAKIDPKATNTFSGATQGKGASMSWSSENPEVGVGTMTITDSKPNERIVMALEFKKPMEGNNNSEFMFKGDAKQTTMTWVMTGKANFVQKAMGVIFNCDKMVGGMFEQGMANLKKVVEK